ncbi:hypothetical protein [Microbacterium sp. PF5]|uniref:hypothetical protein n=1 Tax=Microbacterium sp. PF5 TaxID=2305435 RepID=UPI00109BA99D|nr:hypothetical protein [Microbacterium sp. PF5]
MLDTNVLSHADNPGSSYQLSAQGVLDWMRGCEVFWVLDDNGKSQPDPHTSQLYLEYRQTLPPMGAALQLFVACLAGGRVRFAPRPAQTVRDNIRRLVPRNKKDQVILGAAAGSTDKVLISNDEADFSNSVRRKARAQLDVTIHHSKDFDSEPEQQPEEPSAVETGGTAGSDDQASVDASSR